MKQKKLPPRDSVGGRLFTLYVQSGLSLEKFAQIGGVSRTAMQNYTQNERKPDSDMLIKISKYFSVSTDWLLGLSDVKTTSADLQNAVSVLGITEEAAKKIMSFKEYGSPDYSFYLSELIEQEEFVNLLTPFAFFCELTAKITYQDLFNQDKMIKWSDDKSGITLPPWEASTVYESVCGDMMRQLCRSIERKQIDELRKQAESVGIDWSEELRKSGRKSD